MSNHPLVPLGPGQPYALAPTHDAAATLVTTANGLEGFRVVQHLGLVRGIVVRSRSIVGNFVAGLQMIVGGNISVYSTLCEQARSDAFRIMVDHARALNANAVIAMRYDATEVAAGVTEVLAYGTAVRVEPEHAGGPHR
jgi:uncharacterized protein YbjQ (UPF0145 family)